MDVSGFIDKHADTRFQPCGNDELGCYMVVGDCVVHVRKDDTELALGKPLKDVRRLINKVQTI